MPLKPSAIRSYGAQTSLSATESSELTELHNGNSSRLSQSAINNRFGKNFVDGFP